MSPRFPSTVIDQMLVRGMLTRVAANREHAHDTAVAQHLIDVPDRLRNRRSIPLGRSVRPLDAPKYRGWMGLSVPNATHELRSPGLHPCPDHLLQGKGGPPGESHS